MGFFHLEWNLRLIMQEKRVILVKADIETSADGWKNVVDDLLKFRSY